MTLISKDESLKEFNGNTRVDMQIYNIDTTLRGQAYYGQALRSQNYTSLLSDRNIYGQNELIW